MTNFPPYDIYSLNYALLIYQHERQFFSNLTLTHVTIVFIITTFLNPSKPIQNTSQNPQILKKPQNPHIPSKPSSLQILKTLKNTLNYLIGWWSREFESGYWKIAT